MLMEVVLIRKTTKVHSAQEVVDLANFMYSFIFITPTPPPYVPSYSVPEEFLPRAHPSVPISWS